MWKELVRAQAGLVIAFRHDVLGFSQESKKVSMGRFSGSGAACWGTQSNKKMVTCSNKHSRSSISFFNLISKEIRKTEVGVNPRSAPFGRMLNRRASIQVSETDDEGIIHVPQ